MAGGSLVWLSPLRHQTINRIWRCSFNIHEHARLFAKSRPDLQVHKKTHCFVLHYNRSFCSVPGIIGGLTFKTRC